MKIIAFYLPQYHEIDENNEWWEKGFTEWTSMKRAKSLIENHYQPRIPFNNNYYNLMNIDVMRWQVKIAKENGIYGFCVYHYWFDGKLLLEKPMEQFLSTKDIKFPFFFCWANDEWTNIWKGENDTFKTLIVNHYNNKADWEKHFYYFLPFFKDERYMKENGKPVLAIYNPIKIPYKYLKEMLVLWNQLAIKNGFNGMIFTYQSSVSFMTMSNKQRKLFDYGFEYLPPLISWQKVNKLNLFLRRKKAQFGQFVRAHNKSLLDKNTLQQNSSIKTICDYDTEWQKALKLEHPWDNIVPGAFTGWDNTPRYGRNGKVILNESPEKFREYLVQQIIRAKTIYKKDAIMMFAWNEWSEGGYLEPDEKYGMGFLNAVKEALICTGEFPENNNCDHIFIK